MAIEPDMTQTTARAANSDADQPLVTAVLVCWNHERFVRDAVLSVLNQTYKNIQLIVFDNGSSDGSRRVLEALAAEHGFTLVCQENIGVVRALNKGLAMARGKYFAVLSTDDMWIADKTEKQVAFFEASPEVHLSFGTMIPVDDSGNRIDRPNRLPTFIGKVSFTDLMTQKMSTNGPTVMCRTETLKSIGGYDEQLRVEDFALALEFAHKGHGVYGLPDRLTFYRIHDANWSAMPLYADVRATGHKYRKTPEYRSFVRCYLHGYFRWIAGHRKLDALKLLVSEPLRWTWDDVGVGLLKLMIPTLVLQCLRREKS